jgi:hypothetical protein
MSAIVVAAIVALAVLVMALGGSQFARQTLILMVGQTAVLVVQRRMVCKVCDHRGADVRTAFGGNAPSRRSV